MLAGSRADVDDVVGDADGFLVVLDHDEGVADVAEPHQGLDQLLVVALMQPDRGLVEDVEHADQTRSDLGGEPDPLGLSPGQSGSRAGQGQIVEPTSTRNWSRARTSLRTRTAIWASARSGEALEEASASPIAIVETSWMFFPPTVTARASG